MLGVRVEQHHPLPPGHTVALTSGGVGTHWAELVRLDGAEAVDRYAGGDLAGEPAVTRHRLGAGQAWYVSTRLDPDAGDLLLGQVAASAGVDPDGPGRGVEVVRRANGRVFAINHTPEPVDLEVAATRTRHRLAPGATLVSG